ncbi:MAG: AIR synthase-related protein [Clostridia bacterium]
MTKLQTGIDCAALDFSGDMIVLSTDPITAAKSRLGYLTVHINCNDAAAFGAVPIALLVTILAPHGTTENDLSSLADEIADAAKSIGVDIIGGHTEITDAVTRIVTSSTVIARAKINKSAREIFDGDSIVMTKCAALEGTAVLALDECISSTLSDGEIFFAQKLIEKISVVKEGLIASDLGAHAMHDVTEGGVLGAVFEMVAPFNLGAVIDTGKIPILSITKKLCTAMNLDPLRLISSGSLLIACSNPDTIIEALAKNGIKATNIAHVTKNRDVITIEGAQISPPKPDEIYSAKNRI